MHQLWKGMASGVATGGSGGSMNQGPRAPGGPEPGHQKIKQENNRHTSEKIIKIAATRCHILQLKCTKFDFGWGFAPDPTGGAHSAPQIP